MIGATQIHPIFARLGLVIVILPLYVQVLLPDFEVQVKPLTVSLGMTTALLLGVGLGSGVGEGVAVGMGVTVGRMVAVGAKPRIGSCIWRARLKDAAPHSTTTSAVAATATSKERAVNCGRPVPPFPPPGTGQTTRVSVARAGASVHPRGSGVLAGRG